MGKFLRRVYYRGYRRWVSFSDTSIIVVILADGQLSSITSRYMHTLRSTYTPGDPWTFTWHDAAAGAPSVDNTFNDR
jgi:hypothetical protein